MNALSKIKQVSKEDLRNFLATDHRSFTVLNVSFKQILSTKRTSVILSKPSAKNFYLKDKAKPTLLKPQPTLPADCRKDAQNCQYFALFSSKEKRLHTLFKDKIEANFEGTAEEQRKATVSNGSKQDFLTGRYLAPNQHIFKRQDNTYYYRANEQLIGHCAKPLIIKKSYRLGYHSLSTLPLCQLAQWTKPSVSLAFRKKAAAKITPVDFQEYLITSLLLFCKKAEFINLPLEKEKVPQTQGKCDQLDYTHFQKMPTLRFKFAKENANLARIFMENLDNQAQEFDIEEKQGFIDSRFPNPTIARNAYLNQ
ncbi:10154_t:CDS:2 [Entrophospora sp. SA101]|nr:10154_t:CDS:2 [Entrophospora sp. SA101]